jgi:hypothetical protein
MSQVVAKSAESGTGLRAHRDFLLQLNDVLQPHFPTA